MTPMIGDSATSQHAEMSSHRLQRLGVLAFALVNAASVGVFFVVFIGVVVFAPLPRDATFVLVVGSLAFAVLVMGQFVHWSRLALRALRGRR
jgi:hypothetical protein